MESRGEWGEERVSAWIEASLAHIHNIKGRLKSNIKTVKEAQRNSQKDQEHINLAEVEVANKEIKTI